MHAFIKDNHVFRNKVVISAYIALITTSNLAFFRYLHISGTRLLKPSVLITLCSFDSLSILHREYLGRARI